MHPVLEETFATVTMPLAGCPADLLLEHPGGDAHAWSAWQVVDHLMRSWSRTSEQLEDRLRKNRPVQTKPSLGQRIGQVAVCRIGYLPKGRKSPEMVLPAPAPEMPITGDALAQQVRATLATMDDRLSRAEQQLGRGRILTHPVLGPMSIADWRRFHRTHARHHAPQLQRAMRGESSST